MRQTAEGDWAQRKAEEDRDVNEGTDLPPLANRDAFLTFSAGARNCAGCRFSLQESTLLLAILIRSLKFELKPGFKLEPKHKGIIMSPNEGLPMIVSPRHV